MLYIFEILSAIVTQSDGYQVSVNRFQLTLDSGLLLESQARLGTGFKFQLTLDALNVSGLLLESQPILVTEITLPLPLYKLILISNQHPCFSQHMTLD